MSTFEKFVQGGHLLIINPKLFLKYLIYRIKRITPAWRNLNRSQNLRNINGILFEINFNQVGDGPYVKQMYFGCYQIAVTEAMKKILKPGDTFIDVGAHIGYLTAIGASLVGQKGVVYSFEPVPFYFESLKKLAQINPNYNIVVKNCALGEKQEIMKMDFTKTSS